MTTRIGSIFLRHVLREIAIAVLAVALVLLLLLVTNQFAYVLNRAADGQFPSSLVLELLWLSVRENITVILPISLMLGIVVALGRLYHDSEMAAAQACGVGPRTLYTAAGIVTLLCAALTAWLTFTAAPSAARRTHEIRDEALRTAATRGLAPGKFRSLGEGTVLYFRDVAQDGTLHEVFFQRRLRSAGSDDVGKIEIVLAKSARYSLSDDGSLYTVVLQDGQRYEGTPGQGAWRSMRFREQTVPVRTPSTAPSKVRADVQPTSALRGSADPRFQAEYQWRLGSVLITLITGVLAVPLARLQPRKGRYARVIWGVLFYAIYANLSIVGRTFIEQGRVPPWLGLWWVHGVAIVLAVAFIQLPALQDRVRRRRANRHAVAVA